MIFATCLREWLNDSLWVRVRGLDMRLTAVAVVELFFHQSLSRYSMQV